MSCKREGSQTLLSLFQRSMSGKNNTVFPKSLFLFNLLKSHNWACSHVQCCESFMQKCKHSQALKEWQNCNEYLVALGHLYWTTDVLFNYFSRKKGVYTRDKSKLYLKQYCETVQGIWKVKVRLLFVKDDERLSLIPTKPNLLIMCNWFRAINYLYSFLN